MLNLPRLQRLVLPHLLQPDAPTAWLSGGGHGGCSDSDSSSGDYDSCDSGSSQQKLRQQHYKAALLLAIVGGCPDIKELELVQWQPPRAAVLAAGGQLQFLRLLSVVDEATDDGGGGDAAADLRAQLAAVRTQRGIKLAVDLQLQEFLVLSSFPWSSVLAMR